MILGVDWGAGPGVEKIRCIFPANREETGSLKTAPSSGESSANLTSSIRRQSRSVVSLAGDRGFESFSLQQRVRLSQEPIFVGQEPRLSARVCPAAFPVRSTESRRARQHRTNPQQYLCRAIFQYRISGDAVATSYRVKVARPVPNQVGLPPGSEMPVDLASWDRAQAKPSAVR
jgi:hypothetical protein